MDQTLTNKAQIPRNAKTQSVLSASWLLWPRFGCGCWRRRCFAAAAYWRSFCWRHRRSLFHSRRFLSLGMLRPESGLLLLLAMCPGLRCRRRCSLLYLRIRCCCCCCCLGLLQLDHLLLLQQRSLCLRLLLLRQVVELSLLQCCSCMCLLSKQCCCF